MSRPTILHAALVSASVLSLAATANAQAAPQAEQAAPAEGLGEIIVTATKRSENLQNVPVAITAVNAAQLTKQGVFSTTDLNNSIPNLQVSSAYGETQPNFTVRGIGVGTEYNSNAASPVGIYVDEVYQSFRASHGQQLFDLEQLEVVRGPQGTLYGRNTTGGAINFITRKPKLQGQNGTVTLGYGSFNRISAQGAIEVTPIEDRLGIRIAGSYVDSDPYVATSSIRPSCVTSRMTLALSPKSSSARYCRSCALPISTMLSRAPTTRALASATRCGQPIRYAPGQSLRGLIPGRCGSTSMAISGLIRRLPGPRCRASESRWACTACWSSRRPRS